MSKRDGRAEARGMLSDRAIMDLAFLAGMINPFSFGDGHDFVTPIEGFVPAPPMGMKKLDGVISYGLDSYGYSMRLGGKFKVFSYSHGNVLVDPKNFDPRGLVNVEVTPENNQLIIPPHSFCLGESLEYWTIPENVLSVVLGKSTYCRCGIGVNLSPMEPGWDGKLTIEISNFTPLPAAIYAFEGIAQALFFENEPCMYSYLAKKGKYQSQKGITLPRVQGVIDPRKPSICDEI